MDRPGSGTLHRADVRHQHRCGRRRRCSISMPRAICWTRWPVASLPIPPRLAPPTHRPAAAAPDELAAAALAANAPRRSLRRLRARAARPGGASPPSAVTALGAHGQTVRHDPQRGYTIQLLNGARLAEATGIDTVSGPAQRRHRRRRPGCAAGAGLPRAGVRRRHSQAGDRQHRRHRQHHRARARRPRQMRPPSSATTPALATPDGFLVRAAPRRALRSTTANGRQTGTRRHGAARAAAGASRTSASHRPRAPGRDLFNTDWLHRQSLGGVAPADVQATLLELTARTIAGDCRRHQVEEVFVCGGGAANRATDAAPARLPCRASRCIDERLGPAPPGGGGHRLCLAGASARQARSRQPRIGHRRVRAAGLRGAACGATSPQS